MIRPILRAAAAALRILAALVLFAAILADPDSTLKQWKEAIEAAQKGLGAAQ